MGLDYNEKVFSVHRFGMLVVGAGSLWSNFGTWVWSLSTNIYIYIGNFFKFLKKQVDLKSVIT
jgi:hypothetical protein